MGGQPTVRRARPKDGETVLSLIRGLADFEKLVGPDDAAGERILAAMFSPSPPFDTYLVEVDGRAAGYAIIFQTYSTFSGRPKLYLEDIFVLEDARGAGAGFALMHEVAREAARRGCEEIEWEVLTWNQRAIDFYERLGAERDQEWYTYHLKGEALSRLAHSR